MTLIVHSICLHWIQWLKHFAVCKRLDERQTVQAESPIDIPIDVARESDREQESVTLGWHSKNSNSKLSERGFLSKASAFQCTKRSAHPKLARQSIYLVTGIQWLDAVWWRRVESRIGSQIVGRELFELPKANFSPKSQAILKWSSQEKANILISSNSSM